MSLRFKLAAAFFITSASAVILFALVTDAPVPFSTAWLAGAILILAGGSYLLGWMIAKQDSRRILEISRAAEEIRKGNLDVRVPSSVKDEIGGLAEEMNAMVDRLSEDITKMKKLERIRSEFLGNVSHELRTPIFAIQGMLETLLNGGLEDHEISWDFIERSLNNTQRLNALLSDLIEISRIESGDMKMSFRYFPLKDFICQIIAEFRLQAEHKRITVSMEEMDAAIEVMGDKERLKQALVNLLDNAIKYTPADGSVRVSVGVETDAIRIFVTDTGIGIPEEHLSRIFERFYRVDKVRSREVGGTGLGLAIVKHIIEAHGSKIEVRSVPDQGSTF